MRPILKILLFLLSIQGYSQTLSELEYEVGVLRSGEKEGDKIKLARQLQAKEPFNEIAIDYIFQYYRDRDIDSVNVFFDKLTKTFPKNAKPYILKSRFIHYLDVAYSQKKEFLNKALEIEPNNIEATYNLAEEYYTSFIFPTELDKYVNHNDTNEMKMLLGDELFAEIEAENKEMQKHKEDQKLFQKAYAEKALFYFEKLWHINPDLRKTIYFPIKQLECFLQIDLADNYKLPKDKDSFFSVGHFTNKIQAWECDFTINYLFEIESSNSTSKYITEQLSDLKESNLSMKKVSDETQIYRFTALPSFSNPVCITIEKSRTGMKLNWSIGKGMAGYEPKGIKKSGNKKISEKEWADFLKLFKNIDYPSLPNNTYFLMTDGTTWLLENKTTTIYNAKETNNPNQAFTETFHYLVKLAKIKLERENAY